MSAPTALRTVLAAASLATPLRNGSITSPLVRLDFVDVQPVHDAFTPMITHQPYDLCELAIVSCLQAIADDRPIVILPIVVASRFQRRCLICYPPRGVPAPAELAGRRIGVRAYTQTTGMWVRAHLTEDYGLSTPSMRWLTRERSHVEGYSDPPFVECVGKRKSLLDMLRDGDIDAAILGNDLPGGEEFAPVIADAAARDLAWWQQHHFMPINHMMVMSRETSRRDPRAVVEAYGLLARARKSNVLPAGTPDPLRLGFEALRDPMIWIIETCLEQGLLTRRLTLDEVFGPAADILEGSPA
jgi:4,5-dihydroxyphthalate decarboxylase